MRKIIYSILLIFALSPAHGQTYIKINGLYALVGVINPAVEFALSPHSTFQTEIVFSPWKSIKDNGVGKPMLVGIFNNEYRYYFKERNSGWYAGVHGGVLTFNMTKPNFGSGGGLLKNTSAKGYGFNFGAVGGYQWRFGEKWILDAYFGFGYILSYYNSYALVDGVVEGGITYNKGELIMTPHRPVQPNSPDPFNSSAEWLPTKIGVSIGMLIFDPKKHR